MTIDQAITAAISAGYKTPHGVIDPWRYHPLLDPFFWQSLEKSQGWVGMWYTKIGNNKRRHVAEWEAVWLCFIEHLADGKKVEDFFEPFK